ESKDHGWGSFALTSVGVDYLVTDGILVGVSLHADRMTDPSADMNVEGTGLLAGPYVSITLSPGLHLDASLLYGRSWN
ncbi:autotransporter outer membrane beta-barrel domain-containing protein, partial [Escherichia coli]|uniref:autotransporter domain-containing protein n=1 Tax=Escherichia coli TaxID=562 RepID=UPI00211761B5